MRWLRVIVAGALLWLSSPLVLSAQPGGEVSRGQELFRANCAMCHGADARGMMGMHPALTGVIGRLSREGVEVTIRNGRDTRPPMPAFGERLSERDMEFLLAYLGSLPDGPRNFGPEQGSGGMGGGMMSPMLGGGPMVVMVLVIAGLAGLVGYLLGVRRAG